MKNQYGRTKRIEIIPVAMGVSILLLFANKPDILYRQAKKVSIKSKESDVTVAIDGEPIGVLPATFEVQSPWTIRM